MTSDVLQGKYEYSFLKKFFSSLSNSLIHFSYIEIAKNSFANTCITSYLSVKTVFDSFFVNCNLFKLLLSADIVPVVFYRMIPNIRSLSYENGSALV